MDNNSQNKHILSKTSYIRGIQCRKSLYLNKYHPELRDEISDDLQDIFRRGNEIGLLARGLFPGGNDADPQGPDDFYDAVKRTEELIANGAEIIYEAGFLYDEILCFVDILVKEDGRWNAYEVKSSTKVSDVYIIDASLQYHVITNSGLKLNNFFIVHLNNQYFRKGEIDLDSLFLKRSIRRLIRKNQKDVRSNIIDFKSVLNNDKIPETDIGEHCSKPYKCDFKSHCWSHIPDYSVFNIPQIGYKAFTLYKKGIIDLEKIPDNFPLNDAQKIQIKCQKTKKPHIDRLSIKTFLEDINYPVYFMDFETFMPPVPIFDNAKPYQFIPFQYSIHFRNKQNGKIEHYEYLAETGYDPRSEFIERLLNDTNGRGDILVYNSSFESSRLAELGECFPEYKNDLEKLSERIKDLMIPFQKKYYYSPEMRGRYSIKFVLPALIPELRYEDLAISNGRAAMECYESMRIEVDAGKIKKLRSDLLEYCRLDTYALVKLLEELEEIIA